MAKELNGNITGYKLSRSFWDFSFEHPHKVRPSHISIYFFAIEHCNRLGWKETFGLPTSMVMEATGIKSYKAYKKHFDELVEFGFIKVIEYSKNQYSSNVVALSFWDKALYKALDKALLKHSTKQVQSTDQITVGSDDQSNDSIDKQVTNEQRTREPVLTSNHENILFPIEHCIVVAMNDDRWVSKNKVTEKDLHEFNDVLVGTGVYEKNPMDYKKHFFHWRAKGKKDEPKIETSAPIDYMDPKTRSILYPEK